MSDEATEAQSNDRLSFLAFLGLRLGLKVPDANPNWDFKERIGKDGCDGGWKLIDKHATTPASVHGRQVFEQLVDETDREVLAESAYYSEASEKHVLEKYDAEARV